MKRLEGKVAVVTGEQRYAGSCGRVRLFLGTIVGGIYKPHRQTPLPTFWKCRSVCSDRSLCSWS
jgi:hypothetical protein